MNVYTLHKMRHLSFTFNIKVYFFQLSKVQNLRFHKYITIVTPIAAAIKSNDISAGPVIGVGVRVGVGVKVGVGVEVLVGLILGVIVMTGVVIMLDPERRNHSRIERDLLLQKLESETRRSKREELMRSLKPIVKPARGRRGYEIDETEEELARKLDGRSLLFCTDVKLAGKEIVRTYFQKDHIEKAFRFLRGNACLTPVRYQLPGRVEAYLSVINFIAYESIAAILWKIEKHKLSVSYEELIEEASKIHEVEFTSKNNKIFRWTHITKELEKIIKPFNITTLQT